MKFFIVIITAALTLWLVTAKCSKDGNLNIPDMLTCVKQNEQILFCPYKNGVCCKDELHCCPPHHSCDLKDGLCIMKTHLGVPMFWKLHSIVPLLKQSSTSASANLELCYSKNMACPSQTTCCSGPYIGHDCCPLTNGVCCGDFQHCCPQDTKCELRNGKCISDNGTSVPWYKKLKATKITDYQLLEKKPENIKCADNVTVCYDSDTCCPRGGGTYGCCPIPNAVCCSDFIHCCPSGTQCSISTGTCIRRDGQRLTLLPLLTSVVDKRLISPVTPEVSVMPNKMSQLAQEIGTHENPSQDANEMIICPGGQYTCPDWMTCCSIGGQKYGCCPFPNAVCCSDNKHCCPYGSSCDVAHNKCSRGGLSTPLFLKIDATKVVKPVPSENKDCPDHYRCPDQYTCCQLPSKAYGCCPYPNAVCCDDHVHCCPHGSVCDTAARGCRQGNSVYLDPYRNIMKNVVHTDKSPKTIVCPGGHFFCPDKATCCQITTGQWACCPYEKGICCKNSNYCCPNGYTCDVSSGLCNSSSGTAVN